jgi:DNA-binding NarL/FixJ family response regulator
MGHIAGRRTTVDFGAIRHQPDLLVIARSHGRATERRGQRTMAERSAQQPVDGTPASVLIADAEMLVRAGLRAVISEDPAFSVTAEAADGQHAIDLVTRLRPRLAILSMDLREPPAIEVARRAHDAAPGTTIVLLARPDESRSVLEGFRAGATGFVRSDVGRLDLLAALRRALAGESVIDPTFATELIMRMAAESNLAPRSTPDPLTHREVEILRLVAQGHTNRQIAERLIVAVGTIKVHVEHILGKLGATDRTQAAVRAVELGIVHADDADGWVQPGH